MEELTRRNMLRIFSIIVRVNESFKKSKRYFPEAPYISESIAINEKFLSFKKQLEESTDIRIPDDLRLFFIQDVVNAMHMACMSIDREEEARRIEELFFMNDQLFSEN
ncbi:MAG: hypothetical protein E4H47_01735 [Parcubacteria group bacterium]|nr:MAG: hypothetical protein E4H47_01735 [Parcubacteria group bacterium]